MEQTTNNPSVNASTIEAWNTVLYEKFCRYEHLLVDGLGLHSAELFNRFPPQAGARLLDIGCGLGDTTVKLSSLIGDRGQVIGVDCAENFINASRERARKHGCNNADFLCADVQFDDLQGPYDGAYSRFGTMFFDSPVAALKNIRHALKPGAALHMSVWRKREDNPCFYVAQKTVEQFIQEEDKDTSLVTCGPGPFSMAGADMVSDQLQASGFKNIQFIRFDAPLCIGNSSEEALNFARDLGPAGELIRLASEKAAKQALEIEDALRSAFNAYLVEGGVWATSSTWLIKAVAA